MLIEEMKSSKLLQLLQLLSRREHNRLRHWLEGKWPESNGTLQRLYQILMIYYPDFSVPECNREKIFETLLPEKKWEPNRLSTLMAQLTAQIELFLVQERLLNDHLVQQQFLIQEYLKRGRYDWANKKIEKQVRKLEQKEVLSWEELLHLYWLYEMKHRQPVKEKGQDALLHADYYLDQMYGMAKYRFLLELSEREQILGEEHALASKVKLLEELIKSQDSFSAFDTYQVYLDKRSITDVSTFNVLKKTFLNNYQSLSQLDQSILLLFLINKGARVRLKGDTSILAELMDLYELGIKEQLLFYNEQLTASTFANIVTVGNLLSRYTFVKEFISENKNRLPLAIKTDVLHWAKVHLAYYSRDPKLEKIAKSFEQRQTFKSTFAIRAKVLSIQMWFEDFKSGKEKNAEFMYYLCEAFIRQLKRSKLYGPKRLEALRKFVGYTRDFIRLLDRKQFNADKLSQKKEAIMATSNLHAKKWLLQQMEL